MPIVTWKKNLKKLFLERDSNPQSLSSWTNTQPFTQTGRIIKLCCEYLFVRCIWLYVLIMSCTHFRVNPHTVAAWMSRNSLLETSMISESYLISDTYMMSSYLISKWLQYETRPHDHLYCKQILNHLAKLAKCLSCVVIWLYIFTRSFGCVLTTQFNRLVSLVKWLSVHLRNKWLWIWVQYHLKRIFLQLLWGWGCVRVMLQSLKTSYIVPALS